MSLADISKNGKSAKPFFEVRYQGFFKPSLLKKKISIKYKQINIQIDVPCLYIFWLDTVAKRRNRGAVLL